MFRRKLVHSKGPGVTTQDRSRPSRSCYSQTYRTSQNSGINHAQLLLTKNDLIKQYTDGCEPCQQDKIDRTAHHAPLNPMKAPDQPWQVVSCDMISPLPESNGFDTVEVFVDLFTGQAHMELTHTSLTAEGFTNLFRDRVICYHGVPEMLILDRGPQTVAKHWKVIC